MVTGVLDIRRNDDADELLHELDAVGQKQRAASCTDVLIALRRRSLTDAASRSLDGRFAPLSADGGAP
jgi:hypothetical protein